MLCAVPQLQAQTTDVWSATLTVGDGDPSRAEGYAASDANLRKSGWSAFGSLSDNDFVVDDTTYVVRSLRWATGNTSFRTLWLELDDEPDRTEYDTWTLHIGNETFAFTDRNGLNDPRGFYWDEVYEDAKFPDVGTTVIVKITKPATRFVKVTPTELAIKEGDAAGGTYDVVLATEPTADVTVTVTVPGSTDVSVNKTSLTFTTTNWSVSQTVTVTAAHDADVVDDMVTISHSSSGGDYDGLAVDDVAVTVEDDEKVKVSPTTLTVTEGDTAGGTYEVVLGSRPTADVTVTVTVPPGTDVSANKSSLTFTTTNWSVSQTVTVTAAHDADGVDDTVTISHAASGGGYDGAEADVTVTVTDDDFGVSVSSSTLTVAEGGTGSYTVVLDRAPTADVTVTVTVPPGTDVSANKSSLTFTTTDWSMAQMVTVTAAQDDDAVDDTVTISHGASGGGYDGVTVADVVVTVTDDETASVQVSPTTLTVTEGATAGGTYEVVLATEPSAEVTVSVTVPSGTDVSANKSSLTFTTTNWSMGQTVTVTAAHDADVDDDAVTISHSASGGDYEGLTVSSVAVTVTDDEKVKVSPTTLTVTEGDTAGGTYEVVLGSRPTADVTVTVTVPDGTDVSANKSSLTFTTTNWSMAQTVTVTAAHDDDKVADTVTISHGASGGGYDGAAAADVAVTVRDDDIGVTVSQTTLTVAEGGSDGSYTVVLTTAPSGDVVVAVSSSADSKVDVRDDSVRFSPSSSSSRAWNRPQTIRLYAPSDDDAVDETVTISHSASGGGYDGVTVADVVVTVTDDDTASVEVRPTTLTVTEGDSSGSSYEVSLTSQPTADVTVSVAVPQGADVSANKSSLTFTTTNWRNRQRVGVTAAHDDDGADETVTISHSASGGDYDGLTVSDVVVTVTDDDDIAVSVSPPSLTVTEGDSTGGSYEVVLTTLPSADVTVAVSVPQGSDVSASPSSLTFTTTNWSMSQTVAVTAAHDADGVDDTVTIGHSASGGGYDRLTAEVAVTVDDDDTVVLKAADATVSEDAGNATVTLSLTRIQGDTRAVTGTVTPTAGTAGADDYTAGAVSFTIAGDASSVGVDIPVTDDSLVEGEERFTAVVALTAPSDGSIVAGDAATVTITDDDAGLLAVELASATVTEGTSATFDVTVTLKNAVGDDLTLSAALAVTVTPTFESGTGKASPVDMRDSGAKTLKIPAGSSSAAASFRIDDDGVFEPAETLSFALAVAVLPAGVTVGTASVDATIANNDAAAPRLELWSAALTVGEGIAGGDWQGYAGQGASFRFGASSEFGALSDDDFIAGGTARVVRSLRWEPGGTHDLWLQLDGTPAKAERDAWTLRIGGELFPFTGAQVNPSGAPGPHMFRWPGAYRNKSRPAVGDRIAVRIIRQSKATSLLARPAELRVTEGASGTYELQLTSAPSADVTVAVSVPQDADVSVNPPSLTFTTTNWLMPQTVTVTAAEDADQIDDPVTITHAASGGGYDNVTAGYAMTVDDDDKAEATVSPVTLTLTEGGDSGTYEVVLTAQPSADAMVTVSLPRSAGISVTPSSLTFTTTNWSVSRTVTVTAPHDKNFDDETVVIRHAVSGDGSVAATATVTVTVEDDDDSDIEALCSAKTTARSDPLFGCQWQLENADPAVLDINVGDVWDAGHLGAGVSVAVVDAGLDPDHPDLVANLDASRHRNFLADKTEIADPMNHGTGVAGIIAARDNGIGGRGVAPRATMHAHIIIGAGDSLASDVSGMRDGAESTAVSNNSWGGAPGAGPVTVERLFGMAIDEGLRVGNAGKGTFYVFASGNTFHFDVNLDEYSTHHGVTVVGAVDSAGQLSGYSASGSSLWLTAPVNGAQGAGLTDQLVTASAGGGYEFFGFTSAAAPVVSGVAALLRGAYPALTWRDVKLILAGSARKTDATNAGWQSGALQYGSMSDRYEFNRKYGFGVVDAKAAFDLAATWTNLPTYVKSSTWSSTDRDITIPDNRSVVRSRVEVGDEVEFIEFVEVNATFNASSFRDLKIELVSPSNTVSVLLPSYSAARGVGFSSALRLGSARHLGESSKGTWTLRLTDEVSGATNALTSWNVVFYGHRSTPASPAIDSVVPGAGALTVSWTLPANTGVSEITRYDLRHISSDASDKSDANWTVVAAGNPDPLTYTLGSLTPSAQYDVQVRAVNAQGAGAWSATSTGTPAGLGVLVMPRVLTVTEGDATGADYEVALGALPSADVTVTVTVPESTDVSVNKDSLTFTTTNWSVSQTVTVTAAHDADKVDDTVTITHGASGGGYDSAPAGNLVVTVEDDDVTGLRATPARLLVTEGASASYDVTLAGRPSADVTVTVTVPGGTDVSVNKSSLTFTTVNWRMPQTVTVSAAHDQDLVSDAVTIAHGASGGGYDGVSLNVVVTVNDDDTSDIEAECSAITTARSDPLFGCQWQLENADPAVLDINVGDVWDAGHLGTGVSVVVIDSGLDPNHPDLTPNVDASRHYNYLTGTSSMRDVGTGFLGHGTLVAGIIAARDNRIGGRGVAPRARIHAYNPISRVVLRHDEIADALARDVARTAVANNSYGESRGRGPASTSAIVDRALEEGLRVGNGGKGTFYTFAAGNFADEGQDANLGEMVTHHGVTVVGSVDDRGVRSFYSAPGSNLWLTAPIDSAQDHWAVTTAVGGVYGRFSGTSAATPMVSGVAALLRGAYPALTWRDVKLILAGSARKTDATNAGWQSGALQYGSMSDRYEFNREYGFGVVDAKAAFDLAATWTNLPAYVKSSAWSSADRDIAIPDDRSVARSRVEVGDEVEFIEFVEVNTEFNSPSFRDLKIELVSPSNTVSLLLPSYGRGGSRLSSAFRFGSARHLGEPSKGTWMLRLTDEVSGRTSMLESWNLVFYGHRSTPAAPAIDSVVPGAGALTVSWTLPANTGVSAITRYDLRHIRSDASDKSDANWTVVAAGNPNPLTYTLGSLTAAAQYDVQVRAVNAQGAGPWSATSTGTAGGSGGPPAATISAGTSPVTEGTAASFTVELSSAAPSGGLSISLTVADVSGSDFVASGNEGSKTLSFAVGDTSKTYTVATVADSVDEASGDVTVTVGTGTGYTVGTPSSASVTVNDDDVPEATISAGTSPVTEGTAASFTVQLSIAAPSGGLSIALTVADVSGSDFVASANEGSKTLSFAAGDTSKTYTVATVSDTVDEASGAVKVTVGTGTGYTVGTTSSASVTVNDDDAPAASIKAGTSPVTEGTAASFTVELSTAAPTGGLSISLTVADVSGSDFVASANEGSKTLSFAVGDTSKTYTVATVADSVDEASGNVTVTVGTGTGYTVGTSSSASVTVNDDDSPAATIKAGTSPVTEGTAASFTVELSTAAPSGGLSISLTVADVSGSDFVASANEGAKTLSFAEGDTSKTYTVATVADSVDEASGDVTVTVGTGTGYTVGTPSSASVTVNDDDVPEATISAGTSPVTEGTAASFTVQLSIAAPSGGLSISLTVADVSGSDFVASANEGSKTLSFAAGDTSKTYTVATVSDTVDEASGAVKVTVGTGTGYTVGTTSSASVTVNDDDAPAASIKAGTSPVTEGTAASFTVELSTAAPTGGLSIALTVADVSGSDFVASANEGAKTLSFAAGDTSKTYTVATVADSVDEASGNVTVTVGAGTGYTVGTASSASVTVNDDDSPAATIKAGTSPVTEGTAASFTVELSSAAPSGGLSISLTVADVSGSDFVASGNEGSKSLSFAVGDTSKTYTVATVADSVDEASGAVQVTIGTGTGYTVGTPSSASVTVNDDDVPEATISAGTSPVTEGTAASFTVSLSIAAPSGGLSVALTVADVSGSDFVASANEGSKTLSFAAGDTSKTYTVATVSDTVDEASGAVKVTVGTGTGYTVGTTSSASVTVNDDDAPAASIKAGTSPVTEGTAASFTVELSTAAPTGGLSIALTVADVSGSDFVASANEGAKTLSFAAGDTSKTYTVATVADSVDEASGNVTVTVGAGTGYTVGTASSASVTVNDDDSPAATIKAGTSPVTEGTAASFTVELSSAAPSGGLSISLTVADVSGSDFVASGNEGSKSLSFAVGDTSKTYTVATVADSVDEASGAVQVTIGTGTGYTVGTPSSASVTVNDDDVPEATISAGTSPVTEGTAASFTVSLSIAAPSGGLSVALTVADVSGSDFVASANEGSKTLSFAAGDTSKTYTVATVSDTVDEASGAVKVTVGTGTGYTVGTTSSASVTVNDDDAPAASIKAGTSPVTEGTAASFTVELSTAAPTGGLSIALTVADVSGSDFVASANEGAKTLSFAAGDTSKTYTVATVADSVDEASGNVTVTVGAGTGYTVGTASSASVTVNDDDSPAATIKAGTSPVTEGTAASFTVELSSAAPSGGLSISLTVADVSGSDFVASGNEGSKSLSFAVGDTSKTYTVATVADSVDEASGAVQVTIGTGTGYTVGTPSSASVTVNDDDVPEATISAGTSPVTEGTAASFTVSLSIAAPSGGLSVALTVADVSGSDFVASANEGSKTLSFAAGDTSKTYTVATVSDTVDEASGAVKVTVGTGTGYTVGTTSSASVTVNDDDAPAASIKAGTSPVTEGTAASFTVELSTAAPTGGLSIALTVADVSGSDFVASANEGAKTLSFAAGDTSKTYTVATVADSVDEASGNVTVTVGAGTGYTVGTASSASVTVNDDDSPAATIKAGTSPVTEGTAASFTVELSSAAPSGGLSISLTVADVSGSDFVASGNEGSKSLSFAVGDTSKTYTVATVADSVDEASGAVQVTIGTGTGYTVGTPSSASVTVNDDDVPEATISAGTSPVTEGTAASFTVSLSIAAPSGGLSVALTVADVSGSDFVASANEGSKTLSFAAGDTSKTYTVATVSDTVDEASGAVKVTVGTGTGYTVGTTSSASVTVNDDDAPAASIKAGTSPVTEGTAASFTVELSTAAPTGGLSIALTVADVSGSDFVASANEGAKTLSFAAGDTSKTYTVATVADSVDEASGNVTVTVGAGTGYTVGTASSASVTVNDDDSPAATIKAGTSPVTEGTAASFTVELSSAAPSGGLSISLTVADVSGSDFVASGNEGSKSLSFAVGDTSKTYTVATVADSVDEASGAVQVTIGTGTGYTVGTPSSASVTVNDDDVPEATISAGTSPVTEGTAASFTVSLSIAAPSGGLSVALTVADVSGSDFVASANEGSKTLSFAAGDTSKTYTVATVSDTVDEASGAVKVTVGTGTGYTVGTTSSASVTVNDDDAPAASIKAGTSPVTEGTAASFTVELSTAAPTGGLSIALTVADVSGSDFVASANEGAKTLSFAAGDTSKTYTVATVADSVDEASGNVTVTVGAGTGYTVGTASSASVTVNDDDSPAATIKAGTSPVTEGTAASFTVELSSAAPSGGLSISLTVADVSGSDFVASGNEGSKSLSFAVGDTSKTYTVATVADSVDEASGAVQVTIGTGTGYTVGTPSSASVTVNDDDVPEATISAGTSPVTEGTAASFTVSLSIAAPSGGLSVALTVADVSGSDFVASANEGSKTLSFAAGDTSKTYTVATVSDTVDEASGAVKVTVGTGTGYTVGTTSSASVTVNDDDAPAASIKAGTSPVTEGTAASFTVELSTAAPTGGLSIALTVADVSGSDFVASANEGAKTLSFAAGDTSKTYTVATVADSVDEASGNVTVTVGAGTGYTVGTASSASVTVNDDDSPAATIKAGTSPVTEGTAASFTVELSSAAPSGGLSISLTVADVSGSDFVASGNEGSKSLSFAVGDTSKTYTVATVADSVDEASGAVQVTIGTGTGYTVGTPSSASVTVNDDDVPEATISAGTSPVTEGTAASFTVSLSIAAPSGGLSVALTVADVSGSDFVASANEGSKTLSFAAGDTSKTYTVATVSDTVDEASGAVKVTVGTGTGYTVGTTSSASVTVNDDDAPAASIKAGTSPVTEGTAASFTVELSTAAPTGGLSIALTVADVSGSDFVASANEGAKTLSFAAGDTSKTYTVATVADSVDEASGNVTVTVGAGTGYTVGTASSASVTVNDNDDAGVTVSAPTLSVTAGETATYTVVLDSKPTANVTVTPRSDDSDKATVSGATEFTPANWSGAKTITVTGVAAGTATVSHAATSTDTGYLSSLSIASVEVTVNASSKTYALTSSVTADEGANAELTLALGEAAPTGGLVFSVAYDYTGSAATPADTGTRPSTVTVAANETTATLTIPIASDELVEADETFTAAVSTSVSGWNAASSGGDSATVTITDDDAAAAKVAFGVDAAGTAKYAVSVDEDVSGGSLNVPVTVSHLPQSSTTFAVEVLASGTATENTDYVISPKSVAFGPTDTGKTKNLRVTITDDSDVEPDETIELRISAADRPVAALEDHYARDPNGSLATLTIRGGDAPAVTLSASPNPVTEGSSVTVTATLSEPLSDPVTIPLEFTAVTAEPGDYDPLASIEIPANSRSGTGAVATTQDDDEDDETFTVALGALLPSSVFAGSPSSVRVTIRESGGGDAPPAVTLSASPNPVTEGSPVTVTATLSEPLSDPVTIPLEFTAVTAEPGDYDPLASIEIPANSRSGTGAVATTRDDDEDDETFTVALGAMLPSSVLAGSPSSVRVTIRESDGGGGDPPLAAIATDLECPEALCRVRTGVAVSFRDASTGPVSSRQWDFGDGATSGSSSVEHSWSTPGFYEVTLRVSDDSRESTASLRFLVEASEPTGTCVADTETACYQDSRFAVEMDWWTGDGGSGPGRLVHEGTNDSGLFYFFSRNNWEVLIKVLDGCGVNEHVWVYSASATTLGYEIRVTDTVTGEMKKYRNEAGRLAGAIADSTAFPGVCTATGALSGAVAEGSPPAPPWHRLGSIGNASEDGGCVNTETTLCLQRGRYEVSLAWSTPPAGEEEVGMEGPGRVLRQRTGDSGLFYFFSPDNWEMLVKVLDGCSFNGHHWVYAAAATDLGLDLVVRDTVTGSVRNYVKQPGKPAGAIADAGAFPEGCQPP